MRALALVFALISLASPGFAQSWCVGTLQNITEKTICADEILGTLDDEMTALYHRLNVPGLTREQKAWVLRRNRCGGDIYCIEQTYDQRIAELRAYQPAHKQSAPSTHPKRRPWCGSARLNATERTICSEDTLANLDAALAAIYGNLLARDGDHAQTSWLRQDRDACGADTLCIADAYVRRIMALGAELRAAGY